MATKKKAPAPKVRTRIYVTRLPGARPVRFHAIVNTIAPGGRSQPATIDPRFGTQAQVLNIATAYAKANQPASVWIQNQDGQWREVLSYPAVRDGNERPKKK